MIKQILIVEDDHVLRRLFRDVLVHFNCEITEAATLAQANQLLDTQTFDFIMCDIHLREGNALSVADRCLKNNLPIVIISSDDSYITSMQGTGILAFIVKPVHIPELVKIIQNLEGLEPFHTIRYPLA